MTDTFMPSQSMVRAIPAHQDAAGRMTSGHSFTALIYIAMGPIPGPNPEPSLLHGGLNDEPPMTFHMDDMFAGNESFDEQYKFLVDHLFPRLAFAKEAFEYSGSV